jgi:hypothetical protein
MAKLDDDKDRELSVDELELVSAGRSSCSLVMYNYSGKPVARYHLEHAWPSK